MATKKNFVYKKIILSTKKYRLMATQKYIYYKNKIDVYKKSYP